MAYADLAALARRIRTVERARISSTLQYGAFQRFGLGEVIEHLTPRYIADLTTIEAALKRQLPHAAAAGDVEPWLAAVLEWLDMTAGVGPTILYVIGLIPPLSAFAGPAKLWRYLGMHVELGCAVRAKRGTPAGFSLELRAFALERIAAPIVKGDSEYRADYDARRAHTLTTHPPMTEDCATCLLALKKTAEHRDAKAYTRERKAPSMDCANLGGIHWTNGHRRRDAMRFVAKRVWRDVWRAAHGKGAVTA